MKWKIPFFDVDFDDRELEAVSKVIKSGWLTMGEITQEFERRFAELIGVRHAIAVGSGTAALHLANLALGIGPSHEVICPSLTFVATANSIRYTGATPVFADVNSLDDWNICLESIKKVRTEKTKAIMVVHYAGYPCNMSSICEFAEHEGLKIIEDCAHAPGASIGDKMVGAWGDVGCFSFFSNKNMSTGEGGMLTTNDDEIADNLRLLRSHGMTSMTLDRHKGHAFEYDVVSVGYNYRMTEITAALGLVQLGKLHENNKRREGIVKYYRAKLSSCKDILIPFEKAIGHPAYHIFPILLNNNISRDDVMDKLKHLGVQTSIHYKPIHIFSAFKLNKALPALPLTERIGKSCVTLPLYPTMTLSDVDDVVGSLSSAMK